MRVLRHSAIDESWSYISQDLAMIWRCSAMEDVQLVRHKGKERALVGDGMFCA